MKLVFFFTLFSLFFLYTNTFSLVDAKDIEGVVVEEVNPDGSAEKARIKPGDIINSWTRLPAPPANLKKAKGKIKTIFDWILMVKEQCA
ncbi:hypothetical protein ACFL27_06765 [candidate division CSSED10-310 bacterium]|uniref:PDZ domain-containing protein n=1 Tax=candidate division CSSED10-310 bacterium TaxID=2855610 RepID=A0ABV6YUM5_UNCC1